MIVSLAQAAKLTGKSRQTIYRRANKGELSITKRDDNTKGVDTAELERVFGTITVQEAEVAVVTLEEPNTGELVEQLHAIAEPSTIEITETPSTADVIELENELTNVKATIAQHEERIAELQTDASSLWDQVESQRVLLEHTEQVAKSIATQRNNIPSRLSPDAAVFLLVGSGIGAMTFILASIM